MASSAIKRLQKDARELALEENLSSVAATPLKDNIMEWHVNLKATCGPYKGMILHLELTFPDNYPSSPPSVRLATVIEHPNVFSDSYVCLDMLEPHTTGTPYEGWSSAYSIRSILIQLQTFLFAENIPQDFGGDKTNRVASHRVEHFRLLTEQYACHKCGHGNGTIFPPLPTMCQLPSSESATSTSSETITATTSLETSVDEQPNKKKQKVSVRTPEELGECWTFLAADMLVPIFECLTVPELFRIGRVHERWDRIVVEYCLVERMETRCFHSRVSYKDDILGVGVKVQRFENGHLKSMSTELDIISFSAFQHEKVRSSVWGIQFEFFLPLALNRRHFDKSYHVLQNAIENISEKKFGAESSLEVICTLMNSFVVSLFSKTGNSISRHASEKALLGYCAFHHLLLSLNERLPEISRIVNGSVEKFKSSAENRIKKVTPNLGNLLVYLTITDLGWDDIAVSFMNESYSRQVKWYLKNHPHLEDIRETGNTTRRERLTTTFKATETSRMLLMFQVYFLKHIGRRAGVKTSRLLKSYNKSLGRPSRAQKEHLQIAAKAVLQCKGWKEYYHRIHLDFPSWKVLEKSLQQAVRDSKEKRYHRTYKFYLYEKPKRSPDRPSNESSSSNNKANKRNNYYGQSRYGRSRYDWPQYGRSRFDSSGYGPKQYYSRTYRERYGLPRYGRCWSDNRAQHGSYDRVWRGHGHHSGDHFECYNCGGW